MKETAHKKLKANTTNFYRTKEGGTPLFHFGRYGSNRKISAIPGSWSLCDSGISITFQFCQYTIASK